MLIFGRSWSTKKYTTLSPYRSRYGLPKFNADRSPKQEQFEPQPVQNVIRENAPAIAVKSGNNFCVIKFVNAASSFVNEIKVRLFSKRALNVFDPKKTRPTVVQSELSLEKVTVLRNDLSNADLEAVPMNSTRISTRKKTSKSAEFNGVSAGKATNRIADMFETETQAH